MLYNFATASVDQQGLSDRLADVNKDALNFLDNGGVTRFNTELKWRGDAAALIRQSVQDTFAMTDLTPLLFERRTAEHGDTYEFEKLINTLRVVEYSPMSDPQIFTPRKGKWTISTSMVELAYGIDLFKIMRRQHTIGEFTAMAGEAWSRFYATLAFKSIDTATTGGAVDMRGRALRTAAAGANVTKAELDAALRRMYGGNGSGLTIFGSRFALDPIFDAGAVTDESKNELNARGQIGFYRGARLVEITDDYNEYYAGFTKVNGIDLEKLLFITSGTPAGILLEKDMSPLAWEIMDPRGARWSTGTRADLGVLVHTPSRVHVIQLA